MKKVIISLIFVLAAIGAGAQGFTAYSRENMVKVKSAKTTGTGTVIGYEDDFIYILTSAQAAAGDGVTVTVKHNRYNDKKENSPEYSNINTTPFAQDKATGLAVVKIHKAFLTPGSTAGNHGFGTVALTTDTASLMARELMLTGFAGAAEEPTTISEKVTAYSISKDAGYLEVESDAHSEGYAGAMIGTKTTAVGMLLSNGSTAKGKAAKAATIVAFLKKNSVPHNLIKLGKLQ